MGSGVGYAVAAGAAVAVGAAVALGAAEDAEEPQADRETAQASAREMRVLFCKIFIKILLAKWNYRPYNIRNTNCKREG